MKNLYKLRKKKHKKNTPIIHKHVITHEPEIVDIDLITDEPEIEDIGLITDEQDTNTIDSPTSDTIYTSSDDEKQTELLFKL